MTRPQPNLESHTMLRAPDLVLFNPFKRMKHISPSRL
ncbi:hypothetical protein FKM82_027907 [Ascaphus truei]